MLDNGYIYLAATRLSLFRSPSDWAMTIEVFGFSPRLALPNTDIFCFSSSLRNRPTADSFVSLAAYDAFLRDNTWNDSHTIFPVGEGPWQDPDDPELVSKRAEDVPLRDQLIALPEKTAYLSAGIVPDCERLQAFELCRFLAYYYRDAVLATSQELRHQVAPELDLILTLDEWRHPDIAGEELPSGSSSFRQLARVLETGDLALYAPKKPSNTHWSHWPEGGTL